MTTTTKRNKYAADCIECGRRIQAGEGILFRQGGRWYVKHQFTRDSQGNCLTALEEAAIKANASKATPTNGFAYGQALELLEPKFRPYADPSFGNVDEIVMHAMDAWADRNRA